MKKITSIFLVTVLCLATSGCRKNRDIIEEQELLFQMEYLNYAWGYQHSGFIIDNLGRVLTYENPAGWIFPDENFILTEEQFAANMSLCNVSEERIPEDELRRYASYIESIALSKITALRNTGVDAGTMQIVCYRLLDNTPAYKGCLVKSEGDFTAENLNFYSKKVIGWMKGINDRIAAK